MKYSCKVWKSIKCLYMLDTIITSFIKYQQILKTTRGESGEISISNFHSIYKCFFFCAHALMRSSKIWTYACRLWLLSRREGSLYCYTCCNTDTRTIFFVKSKGAPHFVTLATAIRFKAHPSWKVLKHELLIICLSSVNFFTFLSSSVEPLGQFKQNLAHSSIQRWKRFKLV